MFVMTNDGDLLPTSPADTESLNIAAECILVQRMFIFKLLTAGIAVTILKGAEFRDSKVDPINDVE